VLPASDPNPTAVYRLFGAEGTLLYVGVSNEPPVRYTAHSYDKPWWGDVASKTEEWYPNRAAALKVESEAILKESPRFNRAGSPNYPPKPPTDGQSVSVADFRAKFADYINLTRYRGQVTFLYSRGKRVAALVPAELVEGVQPVAAEQT
jgi:prevent-host-death family protein